RDGGETWARVLHTGPETGAIDLAMDPRNPRVLYAAMWQARLFPWSHATRGPGSALYKSADGGDTWTEASARPGFPDGDKGRIGVTVSPVRAGRVWAIVDAADGGIYRSDDGGATWTWLSDDRNFLVRPWYFGHLLADPVDPDGLYVVNRKLWRSGDGGRSYRQVNVPYVDQMDLWVDPKEPRRMVLGNDGGAAVSFDAGDTWSTLINQPTAEIYRVAADTRFPYRIYGSQQDNSTLCLPSRSERGNPSAMEWYDVGGGESGFIAVRPDNPDIVYASDLPGLGVTRYDHETLQIREIGPWGEPGSRQAGTLRYRFNWSVPVVLSPHDPGTLYVAGNHLFRSTDEGAHWEVISPDLTRNDPEKVTKEAPGAYVTGENQGNHYCTIGSFAESPHTPGVLWTGSDDGLVHVSRDGGATWTEATPPGVPAWSTVHVEPSAHAAAAAYASATAHGLDDFRPYVFKTADFGATWEPIASNLPAAEFVRVIRADPVQPGLLYAGTEVGVHVSLDDGGSWRPLRLNLPVVAVHDLLVKDADLVVGTHGRGMWILDDVTPLRELAAAAPEPPVYLFRPRPVHRLTRHVYGLDSLVALYHGCAGANPPSGVVIYYLLGRPAQRVTVSLLDAAGTVVNTFDSRREPRRPTPLGPMAYQLRYGSASLTGTVAGEEEPGIRWGAQTLDRGANPRRLPVAAGLHRVTLDITHPGARRVPGAMTRGITAPIAPPGVYLVRLSVDGETREHPVEIRADPRLATTPDDYRAQFALMRAIRDTVSAIHDAVNGLRDLRGQIE
ncbi:MAG: glycosyl hydrolase, partial [Chloroflexia bacterium]|nr:glycosyl hydrolase [Chloroflexia bacterium]